MYVGMSKERESFFFSQEAIAESQMSCYEKKSLPDTFVFELMGEMRS